MRLAFNWVLKFLNNPKLVGLLSSMVIFSCILGLQATGNLQAPELGVYDLNIIYQNNRLEHDPPVLLVRVTESDIQEIGQWPITDEILANTIDTIAGYQPRAIGIDLYRDIPVPPGHEQLKQTFLSHPNVVVVHKFGDSKSEGIAPPPVLQGTAQIGFNDIPADSGGIVRRGLLFLDDGENSYFSFPLVLALFYLQPEGIYPAPGEPDPQFLKLGRVTIPPFEQNDGGYVNADAAGYQFLLDYKGGENPFRSISLKQLQEGDVDPSWIEGKVVLLGVDAVSVKDHFFTPYSSDLDEDTGISGLAMHAHIINQFIRIGLDGDQPLMTFTDYHEAVWLLCWCLLGGVIGILIRSALHFSIITITGLTILTSVSYFAYQAGYWVPLVSNVLGWLTTLSLTTAYITHFEKAQRTQLMNIFSKYVSSEVADTIWRHKDLLLSDGRLQSQKLTATVFFTDLQGFTSVSEQWGPEMLMDWLNGYMDEMAKIVINHEGVVDDYFGDAIKANFGVPIARTSHDEIRQDAMHAIDCALEMSATMDRLNAIWQQKGLPSMRMRIGINTGEVVAGSLGSSERMKYTTVGDTVNTAARLESLKREEAKNDTSFGACRILVSEATLDYVGDRYQTSLVDSIPLKGKQEKVTVYRIEGRK